MCDEVTLAAQHGQRLELWSRRRLCAAAHGRCRVRRRRAYRCFILARGVVDVTVKCAGKHSCSRSSIPAAFSVRPATIVLKLLAALNQGLVAALGTVDRQPMRPDAERDAGWSLAGVVP
jgi:hypothetical protein